MVLKEVNLAGVESSSDMDFIRELIAKAFWVWYANNEDRPLTTVKVWILRKTFRVRDLRSVFEMLFGDPPFQPT